jgi:hypothetical protein
MRLSHTMLGIVIVTATALGQAPEGRGGRGGPNTPPSVQVPADRRVRFRLNARKPERSS